MAPNQSNPAVCCRGSRVPDMAYDIHCIGVDAHGCNERMQIPQPPGKAVLLSDIHAG